MSTDAKYAAFLESASEPGVFVVELNAFPTDATPDTIQRLPACGFVSCALGNVTSDGSSEQRFLFSDIEYRTLPTDADEPDYFPDARLARRINLRLEVPISPTSTGTSQQFTGDIQIANSDGELDDRISEFAVDGREVRILFGPKTGAYADLRVVDTSFGKDWRGDESTIRLTLQDISFQLDKPFVASKYNGLGGLGGDPDLAGQFKPRLIGYRKAFTPVLMNRGLNIYQINDGRIKGVIAARDGGAAFTNEGDVDDYFKLIESPISEGAFATCNPLGLMKLRPAGGSLASTLTVEAEGDDKGGFRDTYGAMILYEIQKRARFTDVSTATFDSLNIYKGGFYYDGTSSLTIRDVVNRLANQCNAKIITDSGVRVAALVPPEAATVSTDFAGQPINLTTEDIVELRPDGTPFAPIIETVITYLPRDTVLSESQIIDPSSDTEEKELLQFANSQTIKRSGSAALIHLGSQPQVTVNTDFKDLTSANLLANNISDLWRKQRIVYRLTVNRRSIFHAVGSIANITYPRFGFDTGVNGLIIQRQTDYDQQQVILKVLV